jgi:CheY-like chemotaxis protein
VVDSRTPITAVRMPDEFEDQESASQDPSTSRVLFNLPSNETENEPQKQKAGHLQVLVAEDDPVNSRIIKKRLEKLGHEVYHTVNGEECATAYRDKPRLFDVVLMDMQASFFVRIRYI